MSLMGPQVSLPQLTIIRSITNTYRIYCITGYCLHTTPVLFIENNIEALFFKCSLVV